MFNLFRTRRNARVQPRRTKLALETLDDRCVPSGNPPFANAGGEHTANEGDVVQFDGSSSTDPENDPLTYQWSFGDGGTSNLMKPTHVYQDNGTYSVSLQVFDGTSWSAPATSTAVIKNVPPTATVDGPTTGARGQPRTFTFTASDPSSVDQAAGFYYTITWGDGSVQSVGNPYTVSGAPGKITVDHIYQNWGIFPVCVSVCDKDHGISQLTFAKQSIAINPVDVQGTTLVVGGTNAGDTILIAPVDNQGHSTVVMNGLNFGPFFGFFGPGISQILVYGQAGNDNITLASSQIGGQTVSLNTSAILFGGAGDDVLDARGSIAGNVLVGGDGNDTLLGGAGRDILIGGNGADILKANGGQDVLIGNRTDFDSNVTALNSLLAEWTRQDADFVTRAYHLYGYTPGGLNGGVILDWNTVHDDVAMDQLFSGTDRTLFYLYTNTPDWVNDWKPGDFVIFLTKW